ncbi:unnamed protein product [Choristocarpus tenellus]
MKTVGTDIKEFLENEKDLEFEEEISRNPYRLKSWWRYLQAKEGARKKTRNVIHERALKFLPNRQVREMSCLVTLLVFYKLWHQYLTERRTAVEGKRVTDPACKIVINTHERALIWPLYLQWAKGFGVQETAVRVYR